MSGLPSWKSAEIGLFRPFSAFLALFQRARTAPGKSRKQRKKAFFLRYPRICLDPHLLNPHLRHPNFRAGHSAETRGSFARISRPKTLVRALEILEKTSIWARTSMTRRRGRPRPQGISKNCGQKNFGLNFRSLRLLT